MTTRGRDKEATDEDDATLMTLQPTLTMRPHDRSNQYDLTSEPTDEGNKIKSPANGQRINAFGQKSQKMKNLDQQT